MDKDTKGIYQRLNEVSQYHPGTVTGWSDWTTQAGDVISVESEGQTYKMPVYNFSMTWNGSPSTTIEATGNEKRDEISKKTRSARSSYGRNSEQEDKMKQTVTDYLSSQKATLYQLEVGKLGAEFNGSITMADGTGIYADDIFADYAEIESLYVGPKLDINLVTHQHKLSGAIGEDGTVTLTVIDVVNESYKGDDKSYSFNIADTKAYETLVSAIMDGFATTVTGPKVSTDLSYTFKTGVTKNVTVQVNAQSVWDSVGIKAEDITVDDGPNYYPTVDKTIAYVDLRAQAQNGNSNTNKGVEIDVSAIYEQGKKDGGGTYTQQVLNVNGENWVQLYPEGHSVTTQYRLCGDVKNRAKLITLASGYGLATIDYNGGSAEISEIIYTKRSSVLRLSCYEGNYSSFCLYGDYLPITYTPSSYA